MCSLIKNDSEYYFFRYGKNMYLRLGMFAFMLPDIFCDTFNEMKSKDNIYRIIEFSKDKRLHLLQDIVFELNIPRDKGYIYVYETQRLFKIGYTLNIENRYKKYVTENPYKIEKIIETKVNNAFKVEQLLHKLFKDKRHRGEWFKLNFDDVGFIESLIDYNDIRSELNFNDYSFDYMNIKTRLARYKKFKSENKGLDFFI